MGNVNSNKPTVFKGVSDVEILGPFFSFLTSSNLLILSLQTQIELHGKETTRKSNLSYIS